LLLLWRYVIYIFLPTFSNASFGIISITKTLMLTRQFFWTILITVIIIANQSVYCLNVWYHGEKFVQLFLVVSLTMEDMWKQPIMKKHFSFLETFFFFILLKEEKTGDLMQSMCLNSKLLSETELCKPRTINILIISTAITAVTRFIYMFSNIFNRG